MITAEEPSAERTKPLIPIPIAAKQSAPITSSTTRESTFSGIRTLKKSRPRAMMIPASITNTMNVEQRIASRYVGGGSGVARMRFITPDSRRITSVIPSPAKHVAATP